MYKIGKRRFVLTRTYKKLPTASRFARTMRRLVIVCGLSLLILLLAAFSISRSTVIFGTAAPSNSTPGVGPKVILSPTPVPGNAQGQLVTLPDRALVISNVNKVAGTDSSSKTLLACNPVPIPASLATLRNRRRAKVPWYFKCPLLPWVAYGCSSVLKLPPKRSSFRSMCNAGT